MKAIELRMTDYMSRNDLGHKNVSVLHISPALHDGGVDKLLFDYCKRMPPQVRFGFAVSSSEEGIIEKELRKSGYKIAHLEKISRHPIARYRQIKKLLIQERYDAVHDHTGYRSFLTMIAAWRAGIPCRIAHAHIAGIPESSFDRIIRAFCSTIVKLFATDLFACGEDAARWMWGSECLDSGRVTIVRNAIDVEAYQLSAESRQKQRKELGIEGKFVIGNVARLSEQKNQIRLLRVFSRVAERNHDARLLLVGSGDMKNELMREAEALHIEDKVKFLGARSDVPELLSAMDVFVLPSLFEGLPVVLIEAQANGLPLLVSERVSREGQLRDRCQVISLDEEDECWVRAILNAKRGASRDIIDRLADYEINAAGKKLASWYIDRLNA